MKFSPMELVKHGLAGLALILVLLFTSMAYAVQPDNIDNNREESRRFHNYLTKPMTSKQTMYSTIIIPAPNIKIIADGYHIDFEIMTVMNIRTLYNTNPLARMV